MTELVGRVLIVDDDEDVLQAAELYLKHHVAVVRTETAPDRIPGLLAAESFDVILLDMNFTRDVSSGQEGLRWLRRILQIDPLAVVILITAYGDVGLAVRAIREGATDFVLKPWQNEKLLATISAGMSLRRSRTELASVKSRQERLAADLDDPFHDFIGTSAAMHEVFATIKKVAKTDANVLILGESGTGKELVAREIHRQSLRAEGVFMPVDMGAFTESLFESELFGHKRGAFTDAREDRAGRFEIASGGTLFLDEIGNLALPLQAKLLSALERKVVTRLGSNTPIPVDVRLICATNRAIHEMAHDNLFRQDLLYRINTVEIKLAPLRERVGDIPLLVQHFLGMFSRKYDKPVKGVRTAALRLLEDYRWPGNVRELQHAVERAVIMNDSETIEPEDFFLVAPAAKADNAVDSDNLAAVEKAVIRRVLSRHRGNVSRAARELGLTRTSLYRRIQKHGL